MHGKYPVRYSGGLLGGSWLTAMTSDLGRGRFDGTALVMNFDSLNPANWLWGKQYDVYTHIDSGGARYLAFEKWWGDFIQLNGDELQFLVDNLFIGDKLTRGELTSSDGRIFDLHNTRSPVIAFASIGDSISPPSQALGWILDLHRSVDEIRAADQTIVYCLDHKIGHLAIFVSTKVDAEQDEEFVQMMDVIDCLPPGLHEMIISPRPAEAPRGGFVTGDWIARFEARSLDDIRALVRNSPEDDRAFAAVARLSALNLAVYRSFLQPLVRALANQLMADLTLALNPLRLSYTIFADSNPWMQVVRTMAASVEAARRPGAADNPFLALQTQVSDQIIAGQSAYRAARDAMAEQVFFGMYGSPFVQASLGITDSTEARPPPGPSSEQRTVQEVHAQAYAAKLTSGGFDEALTRAVLYALAADHMLDQRCALAFNAARQTVMHPALAAFKAVVGDQAFLLQFEREQAVAALTVLVPESEARTELLCHVRAIVGAAGPPTAAERDRLIRLAEVLAVPIGKPPAPTPRRIATAAASGKPAAVSH